MMHRQARPTTRSTGVLPEALPVDVRDCMPLIVSLRQQRKAAPFNHPVNPFALRLPDYYKFVRKPMDFGTIFDKLCSGQYKTALEVLSDVRLVWENCKTYNGADHILTRTVEELVADFEDKFQQDIVKKHSLRVPATLFLPKQDRQIKKRTKRLLSADKPASTPSVVAVPVPAAQLPVVPVPAVATVVSPMKKKAVQPKDTGLHMAAQALALRGARGQARNRGKGRTARGILKAPAKPATRNNSVLPESLSPEIQRCITLVASLRKHKKAGPFNRPVDPVAQNAPDYMQHIKRPMDLGTVFDNLTRGIYTSPLQVAQDVRLIWQNCRQYNGPEHPLSTWAAELSQDFERRFELLPKHGGSKKAANQPGLPTLENIIGAKPHTKENKDGLHPLEVANICGTEEIAEALKLFQLQLMLWKQEVHDMLSQRVGSKGIPTDFTTATSVALRREHALISVACVRLFSEDNRLPSMDGTTGAAVAPPPPVSFLEIVLFATHFEFTRHGYGGLLVAILKAKAVAAGAKKVILRSSKDAVTFWRSQEFQPWPETPGDPLQDYFNTYCLWLHPTVLMECTLTAADADPGRLESLLRRCRKSKPILRDYGSSLVPSAMSPEDRGQPQLTHETDCTVEVTTTASAAKRRRCS
eukprot:TRINITY_DN42208_c0_g1_i1.p1 TRINITY_DN42208_c0_g1~~TRINITY_DN42208_c0_g1_i1.p1  ORF type:complete len:641 (-),score=76.63 TRINITY_DN42208_c0_g1_i1:155-2077(-)